MKAVRTEILPEVMLTCITTEKFKTGCLSISLLAQLTRETAASNALIPRVLRRGTKQYPDMEAVSAALDGLYGTRIEPFTRKKGEIQAIGFFCDFPDDAYLPESFSSDRFSGGERLLEKAVSMASELLLSPVTRGGLFLPQYVDSERDKLLQQIRARINEKRSYSIQRLFEFMCYAEDYAADRLGYEEDAESITYSKLTKRYHNLLSSSPIEIFYCGAADSTRVIRAMTNALSALPRGEIDREIGTDVRLNAMEESPRYFTEEMDVSQGKLAIGFRLGDCMLEPDLAVLRVLNAIYGGSVTSKLFMNVREKLSLAYFADSMIDWHKGVMAVSSGIEFDKYENARSEIFAQLDAVKSGDIADAELEAASRFVAARLRAAADNTAALEDFYLSQNIEGYDFTPHELADKALAVTKEDIVKTASGIECDAVYFLKGAEMEESHGS